MIPCEPIHPFQVVSAAAPFVSACTSAAMSDAADDPPMPALQFLRADKGGADKGDIRTCNTIPRRASCGSRQGCNSTEIPHLSQYMRLSPLFPHGAFPDPFIGSATRGGINGSGGKETRGRCRGGWQGRSARRCPCARYTRASSGRSAGHRWRRACSRHRRPRRCRWGRG